ncbi:putative helicase [Paenalcaligenes hominis]|uniref:Helicase n=1 Tax=Paenalcaligenes hominis TaxID=643674 RepID=A0ABX0WNI3_9BURK|nr:type ISP restriction/modification enzyme [Paenalcaligenes hominis]NJB64606.1 putative helicase [Paenalcaligenes hominis]
MEEISEWKVITPDEHGDWLSQRDDSFGEYIVLGDKGREPQLRLFDNFSLGVATNRDAWVYNSSQVKMTDNIRRMIANYNEELNRFNVVHQNLDRSSRRAAIDSFVTNDPTKISWTRGLKQDFVKIFSYNLMLIIYSSHFTDHLLNNGFILIVSLMKWCFKCLVSFQILRLKIW